MAIGTPSVSKNSGDTRVVGTRSVAPGLPMTDVPSR